MLDLEAAEREFQQRRQAPPDLVGACAAALDPDTPDRQRWLDLAQAIAAALDQAPRDLPYHNRWHFAEATRAMGWLCRAARREQRLDAADAAIGVLAMLGHDIDHDGSSAQDGRLEAVSAARIAAIAAETGIAASDSARITDVILATNPALVARNAAMAEQPAGLLRMLANEADVFASLLPGLGRQLGSALAAERNLPPERPGQHGERLAFLRLYERFSPPAMALGLAALHEDQIAAFGSDQAAGAAALDRLPLREANAAYNSALQEVRRARISPAAGGR